jgi:DNA polymerase delta subunit 4
MSEQELDMLREFDLNPRYGPCTGVTRVERWKRAETLKLNPPPEIWNLLIKLQCMEKPNSKHNQSILHHLEGLYSREIVD